jgi:hypothetical protein
MESSMSDMRRILDEVQQFPHSSSTSTRASAEGLGGREHGSGSGSGGRSSSSSFQPPAPEDEEDFSVLRYGSNCVLKSRQVHV